MVYDEELRSNFVTEAATYQVKGLDKYLKSLPHTVNHEDDNTKQYIYDNEDVELDQAIENITPNAIIFSINTFNYKKMGLQGIYDDFYELNNHNGKRYFLSHNRDKLYGFCGWVNRVFT
jgi:hypothetical protein